MWTQHLTVIQYEYMLSDLRGSLGIGVDGDVCTIIGGAQLQEALRLVFLQDALVGCLLLSQAMEHDLQCQQDQCIRGYCGDLRSTL